MYNTNIFSIIKKIEDKKKKVITTLKNVKNEIRYINKLQELHHFQISDEHKKRLIYLFNLKKYYLKEILVLKSAYSIVDQMFMQEIENAETIKRHWFQRIFFRKYTLDLPNPQTLNRFIKSIMDPFKDREQEEWKQRQRQENIRKENQGYKQLICWPFCYMIYNTPNTNNSNNSDDYGKKVDELPKSKHLKKHKTTKFLNANTNFLNDYSINELVQVKTNFYDQTTKTFLWCDAEIRDINNIDNTLLVQFYNSGIATVISNSSDTVRKKKVYIQDNIALSSSNIENIVCNIESKGNDFYDSEKCVTSETEKNKLDFIV
jgi:hypothetical protein